MQKDIIKKSFDDIPEIEVLSKPLIFCHFAKGIGEPKYMPITEWGVLNKILTDALTSYNELNAAMDLVLFEDAMSHICRINRILESPRGNALLVGVGGSGNLLITEAFENPGRGGANIGTFVLNSRGQGGVGANPGANEYFDILISFTL